MLRALLTSKDIKTTLMIILLEIPIVLFSLSAHELSHGFVAYKCGDGTAKAFGRLTLNPIRHLDPIGALCLLFLGFGWAKPVPVNMRYLRKPKRDMVLVSLAGPCANFLLALIFALVRAGLWALSLHTGFGTAKAAGILILATELGILLNLGLGLFNLTPLPPLDGSKILMGLLPNRAAAKYARIEAYSRYIFLGIIIATWIPGLSRLLFFPLDWSIEKLFSLFTLWPR